VTIVSDTLGLLSALKVAQSGDTIQLSAGTYGQLTLNNVNFAGGVRITSVDPGDPAVIDGIVIKNSSGLSFDHLDVLNNKAMFGSISAVGSKNLSFDNLELIGSDARTGNAVFLNSTSNVKVTNTDIHGYENGISHLKSDHLNFSNNTIHNIAVDGIRGGGSSYVTIDSNYFTDFHQIQYAHNDAIQFWTTNTTTTSHDLVITNNTFVRGSGDVLQGIFMNNENGIAYENVTISGNAMIGGAYHGIMVEKAVNLTVEDNLIVGYKDMVSWIQVKNSTNVTIEDNTATSYIVQNNTNISNSNNTTIPQPTIGDLSTFNAWSSAQAAKSGDVAPGTPAWTGWGQLTGTSDLDVFRIDSASGRAAVIVDFTKGEDVLDLRPLLTALPAGDPVADGWVRFTVDAMGTTVWVDTNGGGDKFIPVAQLANFAEDLTAGIDWLFADPTSQPYVMPLDDVEGRGFISAGQWSFA
jgi:hypothetical protein